MDFYSSIEIIEIGLANRKQEGDNEIKNKSISKMVYLYKDTR